MKNEFAGKNTDTAPGLYGLVLCGGKSSRMGTDKSMLQYHQLPQRYHLYEMLQPLCKKVFISCNELQQKDIRDGYNVLVDLPAFNNIGPLGAVLTAFAQYPGHDLLVIGCDYPFLQYNDLEVFLSNCNGRDPAAFYNESEEIFEPLIACYPHNAAKELQQMHSAGQRSLQYFLKNRQAIKFYPQNKKAITGINTIEEFITAKGSFNLHRYEDAK